MLTLWADACADEQNREDSNKGRKLHRRACADADADTIVDDLF